MENVLYSMGERFQIIGNKMLMKGMKLAIQAMQIREPKLCVGNHSMNHLASDIKSRAISKVLIVTSGDIVQLGLLTELVNALEQQHIQFVIFDGVIPDPTYSVVHAGLDLLNQHDCDGVIAFGGGSAMDAAKVISIAKANNRAPEKLVGYFKGLRKPMPLFAVPTTAGTGSEATIVSVISDDSTHAKNFIIDSRSVPLVAALNPGLMAGIPPALTAATGMDALTHAIEAYISRISTKETEENALDAIKLIFENLPKVYENGADLAARESMALASYKAGRAFTKSFLGYVHAIAHQLGAYYGIPHGQGNAIVLPHILEFSKVAARAKLATLAVETGLASSTESEAQSAQKFVDHIFKLNEQLGIPQRVSELQHEDIQAISKKALKEALLNYPVPCYMNQGSCENLLKNLITV